MCDPTIFIAGNFKQTIILQFQTAGRLGETKVTYVSLEFVVSKDSPYVIYIRNSLRNISKLLVCDASINTL